MMTDSGVPVLEVEGLEKHFYAKDGRGRKTVIKAVDGISFTVARGETFGLVGESGCGKTTAGRAIIRLLDPTGGTVRLKGRDISGPMTRRLRRYIAGEMAMIFQDPMGSLNPRMTVGESIVEGLAAKGTGGRADSERLARAAMEKVGLAARHSSRYPHELSGGQRQRAGIARAISVQPGIIIADEPVSSLDVSIQAQVTGLLKSLREEMGLSMVFIAHDLGVVRHLCHRIGVMFGGKLVETAPAAELYKNPLHPYTKALLSAVPHPNPLAERRRRRLIYDPPPDGHLNPCPAQMREILPNHLVYCSEHEADEYKKAYY